MTADTATDLNFVTPPECGGQIVTIGYAWEDGRLYRRSSDASPGGGVHIASVWPWGVSDARDCELEAWQGPVNSRPPEWVDEMLDEMLDEK